MSHYITQYCAEHGEWDMDVDNTGDCPQCEKEGKTPIQKLQAELAQERARLDYLIDQFNRLKQACFSNTQIIDRAWIDAQPQQGAGEET